MSDIKTFANSTQEGNVDGDAEHTASMFRRRLNNSVVEIGSSSLSSSCPCHLSDTRSVTSFFTKLDFCSDRSALRLIFKNKTDSLNNVNHHGQCTWNS